MFTLEIYKSYQVAKYKGNDFSYMSYVRNKLPQHDSIFRVLNYEYDDSHLLLPGAQLLEVTPKT